RALVCRLLRRAGSSNGARTANGTEATCWFEPLRVAQAHSRSVIRCVESTDSALLISHDGERDAAVRLRRKALIGLRSDFGPALAAIRTAIQRATGERGRPLAPGAISPALAPEVPQACEQHVRSAWVERNTAAAGRQIGTLE